MMTISHSELVKERAKLLKEMHKQVIEIGDEDLYMIWTRDGVPDCPDDDILLWIASHDDSWLECIQLFYDICKKAGIIKE